MVIYQPQNGYCYNSDTHILFQFICDSLKKFKNINGDLLDIGSGSGILGLLVAREYSKLSLNQCEIQDQFQFLSYKNAVTNNIISKLYKGSLFDIVFDKKFDIIVSNPPFYHSCVVKSENENIKIARYNDSMPLDGLISQVSKIIKDNGKFIFCYDTKQIDHIMMLLNKYKLNIETMKFLHPKDTKDATIVMIYARKNSKSLMSILPPFIMFNKDGSFTQETLLVYDKCATHSIKVNMDDISDN